MTPGVTESWIKPLFELTDSAAPRTLALETNMATVKLEGWIGRSEFEWSIGRPSYSFFQVKDKPKDCADTVWLQPHTIEVEVPDDEALIGARIAGVDQELQDTRAEAQVTINGLLERKSKLLALTFESSQP